MMKVTDPVCGMTIEDSGAVAKSTYKDKTYYFCSKPCKEDFDKNPQSYLDTRTEGPHEAVQSKSAAIYACPMHPEIRQAGPGSCSKCGMTLELITPDHPKSSKTVWLHPLRPGMIGDAPGTCPTCNMA